MNNEYLAELAGVTKRFGKIVALDGIELNVRPGEVLTVLGPNGSGKTTAISLFLGLQRPDSGAARLFGRSPCLLETRRGIGVMMQEVALAPELRVREHIDLVGSYYPDPLPSEAAIEMAGITALSNRPYGKLSGGQKRQAQFALAICGRPKLLFLDEPTVGLDVQAREKMWATLHKLVGEGCSILLTTHYLQEAEALAHPRARWRVGPDHFCRRLGLIELKHQAADEQPISIDDRSGDGRETGASARHGRLAPVNGSIGGIQRGHRLPHPDNELATSTGHNDQG
jgi:ABC-type multidrug transport system ATPase subunit